MRVNRESPAEALKISYMSVLPPAEFFDWIDKELGKRGLNDHRLSIAAGLSHGFMPNLRAGKKIGYEACAKIADALGVPRPVVYVKAGLDPAPPGYRAEREEWGNLIAGEDEGTVRQWTAAIRAMKEQGRKNGAKARTGSRK